jgi:hypothetical protein
MSPDSVELDPTPIASRKSVAIRGSTNLISNPNESVHTDIPLPASGKSAGRSGHGQPDDNWTSEANTTPPQESDNPQPREEGSGSGTGRPSNTEIPEASAELPPVYSAV